MNGIKKNNDYTSNDLDYGVIELNERKECPFLDKDKYCSIYSMLGEEHLSNICTHFPRILNKIDNEYEMSLDMACPEAARIILSEHKKIEFGSSEKIFNKYIINDEYNTNSKKLKKSPIKYVSDGTHTVLKVIKKELSGIAVNKLRPISLLVF